MNRILLPAAVVAALLLPLVSAQFASAQTTTPAPALLFSDDFSHGLSHWRTESEKPATVSAKDGILTLDTPAGLTLWLDQKLEGPLQITYEVRAVKSETSPGPNDRVSDVNCFWMASDSRNPANHFAVPRTGKFADYNQLLCYYVGLGGNTNSTTRFRRYIGDVDDRPLLPQNDLKDPADLLIPNQWQTIRLVADNHLIQFFRNDKKLFELNDPAPYTAGYFAFRTTKSHLELRNFKIQRLPAAVP